MIEKKLTPDKQNTEKIYNFYKSKFSMYVMKLNDEAQKYVPIALKRLKKSARVNVGNDDITISYRVPYAKKQYHEKLMHLLPVGGDMQSISSLFRGGRQARLNILLDEYKSIAGNTKTAEKLRKSKEAMIDKVKRSADFNYSFGYQVLKGNIPKWAMKTKYASKTAPKGTFAAQWIDRARNEIGKFGKWMNKNG